MIAHHVMKGMLLILITNKYMTTEQKIEFIDNMPEAEFQAFFKSLPARVQLCVRGGMVSNWRATLAEYIQ